MSNGTKRPVHRVVSEDRRFKRGPVPPNSKCLFGADQKPKQIVSPNHGIRGYARFRRYVRALASEVERMMGERTAGK